VTLVYIPWTGIHIAVGVYVCRVQNGSVPDLKLAKFRDFGCFTRKAWRYGHVELTVEFSTKFWFIDEGLGGFECVAVYVEHLHGGVPHLKLAKITMNVACLTKMPVLHGNLELTVGFSVKFWSIYQIIGRLTASSLVLWNL
jgi:hypothetical protein